MPREDVGVKRLPTGALITLRRKLERPETLMKQIGAFLLADAQKAFKEERLGNIRWPARYPSQRDPKVNIAGIVSDFIQGRVRPPKRRFQDRPALRDTSNLLRSLSNRGKAIRTGSLFVEVGTTIQYAPQHQWGGESKQAVNQNVKKLLAGFLKKKANKKYRERLGFLFQRDELRTKINQRPFLGITTETEYKIIRFLVEGFGQKARIQEA